MVSERYERLEIANHFNNTLKMHNIRDFEERIFMYDMDDNYYKSKMIDEILRLDIHYFLNYKFKTWKLFVEISDYYSSCFGNVSDITEMIDLIDDERDINLLPEILEFIYSIIDYAEISDMIEFVEKFTNRKLDVNLAYMIIILDESKLMDICDYISEELYEDLCIKYVNICGFNNINSEKISRDVYDKLFFPHYEKNKDLYRHYAYKEELDVYEYYFKYIDTLNIIDGELFSNLTLNDVTMDKYEELAYKYVKKVEYSLMSINMDYISDKDKLYKIALKNDYNNMSLIEDQTEELKWYYLKSNGYISINDVINPTQEMYKYYILNNNEIPKNIFDLVEDVTEEICMIIIKEHADLFKNVKVQTYELCLCAVKLNYFNIKYVEDRFHCEELYIEAINGVEYIDPPFNIFDYIKTKSYELFLLAIRNNKTSIKYWGSDDIPYEICECVAKFNPKELIYIKNQTDELAYLALEYDSSAILYINNKTEDMIRMAVKKNPFHIIDILKNSDYDKDFIQELKMLACILDDESIESLEDKYKYYKSCVINDPYYIEQINPNHLSYEEYEELYYLAIKDIDKFELLPLCKSFRIINNMTNKGYRFVEDEY